MIRVIPDIPKIHAHWDRRWSEIPTYLEVPMSNGDTVRYVPDIRQPKPVLSKQLDDFTELCNGNKRAGDGATSTGQDL